MTECFAKTVRGICGRDINGRLCEKIQKNCKLTDEQKMGETYWMRKRLARGNNYEME